jgi:hypothetical protein
VALDVKGGLERTEQPLIRRTAVEWGSPTAGALGDGRRKDGSFRKGDLGAERGCESLPPAFYTAHQALGLLPHTPSWPVPRSQQASLPHHTRTLWSLLLPALPYFQAQRSPSLPLWPCPSFLKFESSQLPRFSLRHLDLRPPSSCHTLAPSRPSLFKAPLSPGLISTPLLGHFLFTVPTPTCSAPGPLTLGNLRPFAHHLGSSLDCEAS